MIISGHELRLKIPKILLRKGTLPSSLFGVLGFLAVIKYVQYALLRQTEIGQNNQFLAVKLFLSVFHLSDKNSGVKVVNLEFNSVQLG